MNGKVFTTTIAWEPNSLIFYKNAYLSVSAVMFCRKKYELILCTLIGAIMLSIIFMFGALSLHSLRQHRGCVVVPIKCI